MRRDLEPGVAWKEQTGIDGRVELQTDSSIAASILELMVAEPVPKRKKWHGKSKACRRVAAGNNPQMPRPSEPISPPQRFRMRKIVKLQIMKLANRTYFVIA